MKILDRIKLVSMSILIGLLIIGCQSKQVSYDQQQVLAIGEDKIYLDEMMYHVMIAEFQGKVIGSYFGSEADYWKSEYEPGISMSEAKQKQILEDTIKYQIYYNEAQKEGLTLSEEEKAQVAKNVASMEQNIGAELVASYELSEEKLTSITEKIALATKYYNEQLDRENAGYGTNQQALSEIKIQYLFVPTRMKAESGKIIDLSQEAIDKVYEKMQAYEKQLEEVSSISKISISNEDEELVQKGEISFTEENHPFGEEIEILKESKKIKAGEISPIFSTNKGCYLIQRVENRDDHTVSENVQAALEASYEKLKKQYKVTINKGVWNKVHIGSMTTS